MLFYDYIYSYGPWTLDEDVCTDVGASTSTTPVVDPPPTTFDPPLTTFDPIVLFANPSDFPLTSDPPPLYDPIPPQTSDPAPTTQALSVREDDLCSSWEEIDYNCMLMCIDHH